MFGSLLFRSDNFKDLLHVSQHFFVVEIELFVVEIFKSFEEFEFLKECNGVAFIAVEFCDSFFES